MILNIRTKNVFDRIIMVGLHRKIFEIKADIRIVYIYASYRDSQVFQSVNRQFYSFQYGV